MILTVQEAKDFAADWLPAWTGNQPKKLINFYSEDTFYLDPAIPKGIQGKERLLKYFEKLLAKYPDWEWSQIEGIPMEGGFLNKWLAKIPIKNSAIKIIGVCFVQLDTMKKIVRNEVYFDRSMLLK